MRNGKSYLLPPAVCLLIQILAPRWPRLPAFMNPEPLVRVKTHHALNAAAKRRCSQLDVFSVVAGFEPTRLADRREEVALPFLSHTRRLGSPRHQSSVPAVAIRLSCKQAFQRKDKDSLTRLRVRSDRIPACRLRAELAATVGLHSVYLSRRCQTRPDALNHFLRCADYRAGERGN